MWYFALFMEKEEGGGADGNKYPCGGKFRCPKPARARQG